MEIPITTLHLFQPLDERLISLLRSLDADDWRRKTRAKMWSVKDIAAHLLDGNMRTISLLRDQFTSDPSPEIASYRDIVGYLNRMNAEWVAAFRRVSPALIIEWLAATGPAYVKSLQQLDPFGHAVYSVDWAGERVSQNWFHVAREYTEKWHHQQQIREAVGREDLLSREFFHPVIDTFVRALPHTYRNTGAPQGSTIRLVVTGDAGGQWTIVRQRDAWEFARVQDPQPLAEIIFDPVTAWQLFTNGLDPVAAESNVELKGDRNLAKVALNMISVMA